MADQSISALRTASPANYLKGSEPFPVVQSGDTRGALVSQINAGFLIYQNADRALTSTTAAQKLFDQVANGTLTFDEKGLYELDAQLQLTGMSATSGNGAFSLIGAGTATLAGQLLHSVGMDATTPTTAAAQGGAVVVGASAFTTNTVTAATGTAVSMTVKGIFKVTAVGTIIPAISLVTAAAATLKAGSWLRVRQIAPDGVYSLGPWS